MKDSEREEMVRLEGNLYALSQAVVYPPAPDLAFRVRARLDAERARPAAPARWAFAGAAVAAVLVAVALAAAVAPARDAVADFFDRINIFRTEQSTEGLPTEIEGELATLAEAEIELGQTIEQPTEPAGLVLDKLLFQRFGQAKAAALFYTLPDGRTFILFATNTGIGKGLASPDSESRPVSGLPGQAFWLEGKRIVQYYDPDGRLVEESVRATDTNSLIWDQHGLIYKLEGDLPLEDALAIAQSVRDGRP